MAPFAVRSSAVAETPASCIAESSVTLMAPPVSASEPKWVVSPTESPSVMEFAPASKVARPVTASAVPVASVIAPPAYTESVPLRVSAGTTTAALEKSRVTLRRLAGRLGANEPLWMFRSAMSR